MSAAASGSRSAAGRSAGWLIAALGLGIGYAVLPYLPGLLGGAILYVLTAPLCRRAARRLGPRGAALAAVAAVLVVILLPGIWLVSVAVGEFPRIVQNLGASPLLSRLPAVRLGGLDLSEQFARLVTDLVSWSSRQAASVFESATRATLNLVVALTALYYLLLDPRTIWRAARAFLPFSDPTAEALRTRFHSVTESMVLGTALTALLQGTVIGLAFWVIGLSNALFWGFVTAVASVFPVLGSALVWLPGVGVLLLQGRYGAAAALAAIGALVASTIDNVARPLVYRRVSNVHPMVTLVGAFAGVGVFGFVGVLLGPLAISYFFELLKAYQAEYGPGPVRAAEPAVPAGR